MGIIDRAVQRVHEPLVAAAARHQADFLGDDLVPGKEPLDLGQHQLFGLVVDFGDQVDGALVVHLVLLLIAQAQNFTGLAGQPFEV